MYRNIYLMTLPYAPVLFRMSLNVRLILEYLGLFIAYKYCIYLRKKSGDTISSANGLSIIISGFKELNVLLG